MQAQESSSAARVRLIIDTDAGVDDAQAILTALLAPGVVVEAITTCAGNCAVDQVCINVAKILAAAGESAVPVYRGATHPLMGKARPFPDATYWHGADGLGDADIPHEERVVSRLPEHAAALAIATMARRWPGELTLVAIGPLTNVAIALQLEPSLPSLLRRLVFMGGDRELCVCVCVCVCVYVCVCV
jgi:purine nucleosidase